MHDWIRLWQFDSLVAVANRQIKRRGKKFWSMELWKKLSIQSRRRSSVWSPREWRGSAMKQKMYRHRLWGPGCRRQPSPKGMICSPENCRPHQRDLGQCTVIPCQDLSGINGIASGIVHRIDKNTSGLLMVANDQAHVALGGTQRQNLGSIGPLSVAIFPGTIRAWSKHQLVTWW